MINRVIRSDWLIWALPSTGTRSKMPTFMRSGGRESGSCAWGSSKGSLGPCTILTSFNQPPRWHKWQSSCTVHYWDQTAGWWFAWSSWQSWEGTLLPCTSWWHSEWCNSFHQKLVGKRGLWRQIAACPVEAEAIGFGFGPRLVPPLMILC